VQLAGCVGTRLLRPPSPWGPRLCGGTRGAPHCSAEAFDVLLLHRWKRDQRGAVTCPGSHSGAQQRQNSKRRPAMAQAGASGVFPWAWGAGDGSAAPRGIRKVLQDPLQCQLSALVAGCLLPVATAAWAGTRGPTRPLSDPGPAGCGCEGSCVGSVCESSHVPPPGLGLSVIGGCTPRPLGMGSLVPQATLSSLASVSPGPAPYLDSVPSPASEPSPIVPSVPSLPALEVSGHPHLPSLKAKELRVQEVTGSVLSAWPCPLIC
jgi:hypothetical protein